MQKKISRFRMRAGACVLAGARGVCCGGAEGWLFLGKGPAVLFTGLTCQMFY